MDEKPDLLPPDWSLPDKLRDRLGTSAGRQRMLEADGHLLLVLHVVPGVDEVGRRGRFFWRDPSGNWQFASTTDRVATLDEHLNEYRLAIESLEHAEETARNARDFFELLDRLTPLSRATRNMYAVLQQARETLTDDREFIVMRDQASDLARRVELLHDEAKNGLDFAVAWQGEQLAEISYQMSVATHRLNLLAAFFFPIVTLMAIFGANLQHGLEEWDHLRAPFPLIAVIAVGLLFGLILTGFVTRPARKPQRNLQSSSPNSPTSGSK